MIKLQVKAEEMLSIDGPVDQAPGDPLTVKNIDEALLAWQNNPGPEREKAVQDELKALANDWVRIRETAEKELSAATKSLDDTRNAELLSLDPPSRKLRLALARATQILAAVSSYAQHYSANEQDPQQVQAERAARKKAIESLIDQATSRNNRQGDWIVSLGANVGLVMGYQGGQKGASSSGPNDMMPATYSYQGDVMPPQLSLPMGLAVQRLPSGAAAGCAGRFGLHLQLSPIDLGQFLSYSGDGTTNIDWPNFLMVGLQGGMLFSFSSKSRSTDLINLGLDARYAPGLRLGSDPNAPRGAFRVGFYVSYYVPFFDFN